MHIGGDEIRAKCWDPIVNSSTTTTAMWQDFAQAQVKILDDVYGNLTTTSAMSTTGRSTDHGGEQESDSAGGSYRIQVWGGAGDGNLFSPEAIDRTSTFLTPEQTQIQMWDNTTAGSAAPAFIKKGYSVILSDPDFTYLDGGEEGWEGGNVYWLPTRARWAGR